LSPLPTVPGYIWEADHEMVQNLRDLASDFWVLLRGVDPSSERTLVVVKHFIKKHPPRVPVVDVCIKTPEEAGVNKVAILPQMRVYHRGFEVFRHSGTVNIDVLNKVFRMTLRFD